MNSKSTLQIILLCATMLLSCTSGAPPDLETEQVITGIVKDLNGNPVADAYLNFVFQMTSASSSVHREGNPDETMPSTTIAFSIPGRSHVKMAIENYAHQIVSTLVDDTLNGGSYMMTWNGKDSLGRALYTDCYFYRISIGGNVSVGRMLLIEDQHLATNPVAYVKTDQAGRFSIPLTRVPLHEVFIQRSSSGEVIGSLKLADVQKLYAFTPTHYGVEDISVKDLQDHTIILSAVKYGQ